MTGEGKCGHCGASPWSKGDMSPCDDSECTFPYWEPMTSENAATAEMPGVEEIERLEKALRHAAATASNDDYTKPKTIERGRHCARVTAMLEAADALALFAPILAEKERMAGIADAYAACESVARKRVDHIDPALEERLPALCEISRETWLAHKERAPIMAVDLLEHAKRKALEARALAAEAALAAEKEGRRLWQKQATMHGEVGENWQARALKSEAALAEIAGQDVVEIALDPDWPRRIAAAAIRAQGAG